MAHLNVAEKRIEACIAYVGRRGAPRNDNELVPTDAMLGDCPLHVRLVAREATEALLRDVDGVVVVLDAAPSAHEQNQSVVMQVRSALRERATPVVVQVDDVAEEAVASLSATEWPHVSGVDETFQRVVGAVMQSITAEPTENDRVSTLPQKHADGHPLLSALRRVLEATAEQQAQAMAAQLERKLEARLTVLERRTDALGAQLSSANEELLKAARHACSREDLATATADIRTEIMHAVADKLDELLVKLDRLQADESVETQIKELLEELRRPKKGFFG